MLTALGQSGTSERRYRVARTNVLAARFFYWGDSHAFKKVLKKSGRAKLGGISPFIPHRRGFIGCAGKSGPYIFQQLCFFMHRSNAMRIMRKSGQNVLEYTMLIIICAVALLAMTTYVQRAMNSRLTQAQDELNYYRAE